MILRKAVQNSFLFIYTQECAKLLFFRFLSKRQLTAFLLSKSLHTAIRRKQSPPVRWSDQSIPVSACPTACHAPAVSVIPDLQISYPAVKYLPGEGDMQSFRTVHNLSESKPDNTAS